MLKNKKIRIAKPAINLHKTEHFYCEVLGFEKLGGFIDHDGFDGIMLGYKDNESYHLEFTVEQGSPIKPETTPEDLLVFYISDTEEYEEIIAKIDSYEVTSVKSHNPYWDLYGKTYVDPNGYLITITNQ
jgi:catechol 2,3-dioxygenase-like lactoylglutathione lyase family enzyme